MKQRLLIFFAALLTILAGISTSRAERVVTIGSRNNSFYDFNPATGALSNRVKQDFTTCPDISGDVFSLAKHPGTGVIYGIVGDHPHILATFDPNTAELSPVALLENIDHITTITFGPGPSYPLYAILGKDGAPSGSIHRINLATGIATPTGWTTAGVGGHALEFNPDDGMLYHFYSSGDGGGNPDGLEKINPATGAATPVVLSGAGYGAVNAVVYAGSNLFYAHDQVDKQFLSVTTGGVVTVLAATTERILALEYIGPNLLLAASYLSPNSRLIQINPTTGINTSALLYPDVPCIRKMRSITRDRDTGDFYVITNSTTSEDRDDVLAKLNLKTGAITDEVMLTEMGFGKITAGPGGQIYGLQFPSGMDPIIYEIDKATGQATATGWATSGKSSSLEYNPDDGQLYHIYHVFPGPVFSLEKIDPGTGLVTPVGELALASIDTVYGFAYRGNGSFYVIARDRSSTTRTVHRISTSGDTEVAGTFIDDNSSFAQVGDLVIAPDTAAAKAALHKKIRKLKKRLKNANRQGQRQKARRLKGKIRKLNARIRRL